MSLSSIKRAQGALTGKGMAIAGLVMGYISIAFAALLLVLVASGLNPLYAKIKSELSAKTAMRTGYQIHQAIFAYSTAHQGKLPDTLEDLVMEGLVEEKLLTTLPPGYPADFWEYRGKGLNMEEDDSNTVILQGKPQGRFRVEVKLGGSCKVLRDDE